jgi:hypothetical protein
MAGYIGVKEAWAPISTGYTKVSGEWRQVKSAYAKVNGQWEEVFSPALNTIQNFKIKSKTADEVVLEWDPNATAETYSIFISETPQGTYLDPVVTQQPNGFQFLSSQNKVTLTGTGTIALNILSPIVTGTGTSFTSQIVVDEILFATIGGTSTYIGKVKSIESNTKLTLYTDWTFTTASGLSFAIYKKNTKTISTTRETNYKFFVNSLDASNNPGISSPQLTRSTPIRVPDPPVLTVKFKDETLGKITIAWTRDRRATSYDIYRNKTGSFVNYANVTPSGEMEEIYVAPNDPSGEDYAYYVVAKNNILTIAPDNDPATAQQSSASNSINFVSTPPTLGNISLKGVSVDHNSVKLQWTDVANADRYFIQIEGGTYGTFSDDIAIATTTVADANRIEYTVNLANETNYKIRIRARGAAGTIYEASSAYSNEISVSTGRAAETGLRWVAQTDKNYTSTESTRLRTTVSYYDPYDRRTFSTDGWSTYSTSKAGVGVVVTTSTVTKSRIVNVWQPGRPGYWITIPGFWTGTGRNRRWVPARREYIPGTPGRYVAERVNYNVTETTTKQYYGIFYTPITSSTAIPAASRLDAATFRFYKDTSTSKGITIHIGTTEPSLTYFFNTTTVAGVGTKSFVSKAYYDYLKLSNVNSVIFTGTGAVANFDDGRLIVEWSNQEAYTITSAIAMSITGNK